jgi:2-oxo-3-hexenedioate decarboxylase
MTDDQIAAAALAGLEGGGPLTPFSQRETDFDLARGYRVLAALRRLRQAKGMRPVGRKIGFTNRTIWADYGVYAPIWGDMYDSTVADLPKSFSLAALAHPKIEPEIAFGLARAPAPDMDEAALLGCVEWVAHGYEIVQSPFPNWRFAPADTVAAGGMHAACLLGPRRRVDDPQRWLAALSSCTLDLARNGEIIDRGAAANVLDGPLSALKHLVALLATDPVNPPVAAGEIITTGTLTRAFDIVPGETWRTTLHGIDLAGIEIRFT